MTTNAEPVLRLTRPEEWLQAIPYLFGFAPADSLVLLGLVGPRKRVGFQLRVDLPTNDDVEVLADHVAQLTARQDVDAVMVVLYGEEAEAPTPLDRDLWDSLELGLEADADVEVVDALVVRGDRWWSLTCPDPRCCPPEGTRVELDGRVAAEMVLRGCVVRGSREELAAEIGPVGGPAERLLAQRCAAYADAMLDTEPMWWSPEWVDAAVHRWRLLLSASVVEPTLPDPDSLAALLVPLEHKTLRDRVAGVCLLSPDQARPVLRSILRRAPREQAAAPATILGLLEWAGGDGIRAMLAFERALGADPDYSFANLLVQGLQHGVRLPEDFVESIRQMGRPTEGGRKAAGRSKAAGRPRRARPAR